MPVRSGDRVRRPRGSNGGLPIYAEIKRSILEQIDTGQVPEGGRLTPEVVLAERYGVSRPTVRQAILELAREGIVARRRGAGTIVLPRQRLRYPVGRLMSFSEEFAALGSRTSSEVVRQEVVPADHELAVRLGTRLHEPVFCLERVRRVDGRPVAWQRSQIQYAKVPGIEARDFAKFSLYEALRDRYRLVIHSADELIQARIAAPHELASLSLEASAAVFQIERRSFGEGGDLVELVDSVYRSDRYEIRLTLTRQ
jgi:GntR family transcriptional regulator